MSNVKFDATLADQFMPHYVVKQAVLVPVPEGVETTINAEWGAPQSFIGPWYAIYKNGEVAYGSGKIEFEETHGRAFDTGSEVENGYYKNTPIMAYQYTGPDGQVVTQLSTTGAIETVNTVHDGDWLVRWPHGEVGVMEDHKFRGLYDINSRS